MITIYSIADFSLINLLLAVIKTIIDQSWSKTVHLRV